MNETLTFDAGWLARAWLSVAEASSKDKARPALSRTVCVEFYADGVRLVATDSYMLLTAWVPCFEKTSGDGATPPAPELDEAPYSTVVAIDEDGRAKGLFAYLLGLTEGKDHPEILVRLTEGPAPETTGPALVFDSLNGDCLTIAADDREALILGLYDGGYPTWRALLASFSPQRPRALALSPDILGRVVKAAKVGGADALHWWFGGAAKASKIEIEGRPNIDGLLMPVRWVGSEVVGVNPPAADDDEASEPAA
jgi:hypothetical protein